MIISRTTSILIISISETFLSCFCIVHYLYSQVLVRMSIFIYAKELFGLLFLRA
jgi:hypothetical protein